MAIEDALALVRALRAGFVGGLERYVASRHARVKRVQLASRRLGSLAHWTTRWRARCAMAFCARYQRR